MITLRPYQQKGFEGIQNFFLSGGKHAILEMPTGGGKTITFCYIAAKVVSKKKKTLILTDRRELYRQAANSLRQFDLHPFMIIAGTRFISKSHNVYVGSSQTLKRRYQERKTIEFLQTIDLFIFDECHKQEFNYLFISGLLDKKHVLGFSATPMRTGKQRQLGLDYETIISTVTVPELINNGSLVNYDYYGFEAPDVTGVKYDSMKGDFQEKSMFNAYNTKQVYAGLIKNYKTHTPKTKTLVFCCNIEHTIKTCLEFRKNGIEANFVVSNVGKPKEPVIDSPGEIAKYDEKLRQYEFYIANMTMTRDDAFAWFENSTNGILCNAGIATTGYDCPSIETIVIYRATMSLVLLKQIEGRGSRPNKPTDKTHFNVLDFGENEKRLGKYTDVVNWSLWHEESKGGGVPPMKVCGQDAKGRPIGTGKGCVRLILAMYKMCPFCGFKYPDKTVKEAELQLVSKTKAYKSINQMSFKELVEYTREKGHKQAWLWLQLWLRGGEPAIRACGAKMGWKRATINTAINIMEKRRN